MDCSTERLIIRPLEFSDSAFIVQLFNQKSFIDNIADKQVRTIDDAIEHLKTGPIASYQTFGFGLSLVELKQSNEAIGICGLLKRPELQEVDLGYALLDQFAGKGYAWEAARAVVELGFSQYHLAKIAAVTDVNNLASIGLLNKLGFKQRGEVQLYGEAVNYYLLEKLS